MDVWASRRWEKFYSSIDHRSGLRLKFDKNVDCDVKQSCKEFAKWLRKEFVFPQRVPVYLKATKQIKARDGQMVSAIFFEPDDRAVEPYIRVAVGDYHDMLKSCGRDNAMAGILHSIAHELTHYFQWVNSYKLTEIGSERQATVYAGYILEEYKDTREHP